VTSFLSAISVGRRRRWLIFGVALVLIAVAAPLGTKFQNAQQNDPSAFLPGGAESVRSLDQQRRFPSGAETPAVTVFHRDGGLTSADRPGDFGIRRGAELGPGGALPPDITAAAIP
jgi:RND superfamily putative drug exporter